MRSLEDPGNIEVLSGKLESIEEARHIASGSLNTVLKKVLSDKEKISEMDFHHVWHAEMQQYPQIFGNGWYTPPPNGIGVIFSSDNIQGKDSRLNYKSLRPENASSQKDSLLDHEHGLIYAYTSPVHKKTGMIGDFGITIYLGQNPDIINHLKACLKVNHDIADEIQPGMTFTEIYHLANQLFEKRGLTNLIASTTDTAGVNIGHTVPASYENWSSSEYSALQSQTEDRADVISEKRIFINPEEKFKVKPGMALTIEPRLVDKNKPNIPMLSYHIILIIEKDGTKKLLTQFDDIFQTAGMTYMME